VTSVVFHPLAERELVESARFYETRAAGLGSDFIRSVESTLAQIVANPEAGSPPSCGNDSASIRPTLPFRDLVSVGFRGFVSYSGYAPASPPRLLEKTGVG
jgi:hypothetical protein